MLQTLYNIFRCLLNVASAPSTQYTYILTTITENIRAEKRNYTQPEPPPLHRRIINLVQSYAFTPPSKKKHSLQVIKLPILMQLRLDNLMKGWFNSYACLTNNG